jgi:hypothetical protein
MGKQSPFYLLASLGFIGEFDLNRSVPDWWAGSPKPGMFKGFLRPCKGYHT